MRDNMYLKLFFSFLKLGLFTIGGGMAMLPLITKYVSEDKKWLTEEEMLDGIAVAQSLPGVIAINISTYVGMKKKGIFGAVCATLGTIFPSFVIIIGISLFLGEFSGNVYVDGALIGLKACAAALIVAAGIRLGKSALKNPLGILIAAAAFVCIALLGINAVFVIIGAAFTGIIANAVTNARRLS